jgi:hypothetical protein
MGYCHDPTVASVIISLNALWPVFLTFISHFTFSSQTLMSFLNCS